MTALSIQPTFPIFTDIDGQPLEDGYVFIGTANLNPITNPITVYWDAALTLTAVQPIRTLGGYPMNSGTPARLYVNSDYSIQVQNKNGSLIYSALAATERYGNVISSADVSFIQSGTGAVLRTAQSKMRDWVTTADFGVTGASTTSQNATALTQALAASDYVVVSPGTYDNLTISGTGKTLWMQSGVVFKLPNGTVVGGATSGPSVLAITGSNCTIIGDFEVNGNKANNNAGSFPTSVLTAALHVSGANCKILGTVTILNAYWRGLTVENGSSSGNEVDRFCAYRIKVLAPASYAVMMWCVKDWFIDEIEVDRSTTPGWEARVRFGSQSSSTGQCLRGHVNSIRTNGAFVTEANTVNVTVNSVQCGGGKIQESVRTNVGIWIANGTLMTDESSPSFAMLISSECGVGQVVVSGHLQSSQATSFTQGNFNCSVGSLVVKDTTSAQSDCILSLNDGLHIGSIRLKGNASGGKGFVYFYDASTKNITIDSLNSTGHTTNDVEIASNLGTNSDLRIGSINKDAVTLIGIQHGRGSFSWTTGTSSITISDPNITTRSFIHITPRDADAGVIMHSIGYYITQTAGSFTILTGTGGNTPAQSEWDYLVNNGL